SCRGTSTGICGRRRGCGVRRGMPRAMCASELAARRLPVNGLVVAASAAGPSRALLATALLLAGCSHDLARSRDILFVAQRPCGLPDGAALHFTGVAPDHRAALYVIHSDGSGLRRILPDSISLRCPSWAPDGHQFTVSAYRAGRSSILAVDLDSGAPRTLLAS